jgi:hypothetical protein
MAIPSTDNNGTAFFNINNCKSFNLSASTALKALSAFPCSEVYIVNKSNTDVYIYDSNYFDDTNRFLLSNNESITIRGITNSSQVSAKTLAGGGAIYFRTQYFSFLPQR